MAALLQFILMLLLSCLAYGAVQLEQPPELILGGPNQSCHQACAEVFGGPCVEDQTAWPQHQQDFDDMVKILSPGACSAGIDTDVGSFNPSINVSSQRCSRKEPVQIAHNHSIAGPSAICSAKPPRGILRMCLCAASSVLKPSSHQKVQTEVVPINQDTGASSFPEAKVQIALSFSGGGSRAMTGAIGVLRSLEHLDLMKIVDGISCASGGCWGTGPYMFAQGHSTDEMLGSKTQNLNQLNMETLRKTPPLLARPALNDICPDTVSCLLNWEKPWKTCWTSAVGKNMFAPFGLDDSNGTRYMSASNERVQANVEKNPDVLTEADFMVLHADRPKTYLITGALLSPEGGYHTAGKSVTLQMGPDWNGIPFYPDGRQVTYTKPGWGPFPDKEISLTVGGGLHSEYTFGGFEPVNPEDQKGGKKIMIQGLPEDPVTLAEAASISSSAFAYAVTNVPGVDKVVPRLLHWPVTSERLPTPQEARIFKSADGGILENLALLPWLQRKVPRVAVFFFGNPTARIPDKTTYNFCEFNPEGFDFEGKVSSSLADKFGFFKEGMTNDFGRNRVFREEDLGIVLCALQEKKASKQAGVVRHTLTVQANSWWGIEGGWAVDLLLLYTDVVTEFEEALPSDTRAVLAAEKEQGSELYGYPFMATMGQHPSSTWMCHLSSTQLVPAEINLYAAQAEYAVTSNADVYRDFFRGLRTDARASRTDAQTMISGTLKPTVISATLMFYSVAEIFAKHWHS